MKFVRLRSKLGYSDLGTFQVSSEWKESLPSNLSETLHQTLIYGSNSLLNTDFEKIREEIYTVRSRLPYFVKIKVKKGRKYLHISLTPVYLSPTYEERAENLTKKQLDLQPSFHGTTYIITDLLKSGEERLQVLGFPGFGKTFSILKSARVLANYTEFLPIILGFYGSSEIYTLDPSKYIDSGKKYDAAKRIAAGSSFSDTIRKLREGSNNFKEILMLDDVHYMFRAVKSGRMRLSTLCDVLEKVDTLPEKISKVLVSDDPLCCYDEQFNNKRLHSVLFNFGELSFEDRKEATLSGNYEPLIKSALTRLWIGGFDKTKIASLLRAYGRSYDYEKHAPDLLNFFVNGMPRKLVIFLKEFTPDTLSVQNLLTFLFSKMESHGKAIPSEIEEIHQKIQRYNNLMSEIDKKREELSAADYSERFSIQRKLNEMNEELKSIRDRSKNMVKEIKRNLKYETFPELFAV